MRQKGFVTTTTLIIIVSSVVILSGITATGVVLYKQDKLGPVIGVKDKFFDLTSDIIFNITWKDKYEKKMLEAELEFSNIKKDQAENRADEEAVAKAEAQEKAEQEEILKNKAEAEAKQAEYEKKLKEKELSEKEAEEEKMNADNDNDGLTYREESNLGTSDWSNDSDGDGIKDGEDAHPAGGGRYEAQYFKWDYGGYEWEWTVNLHIDWVEYYRNKTRGTHPSEEYVTAEDPFIEDVANKISEAAENSDLSKSRLALAFVQSLGYVDDSYTGYNEYPKYPVETFFERNGDCEDSSYLAASIIGAMNIDNMLLLLPGHMAIAVWIDCSQSGAYYKLGSRCYYYGETTAEGWKIGEMPSKYQNSTTKLIDIDSGDSYNVSFNYNQPCEYSSEVPGYYTDGDYFYSDSNCNNVQACIPYEDWYYNYFTEEFYWDAGCDQIFVEGCIKSTSEPGYFTNDSGYYYYDSRCTNEARICKYYPEDGYYFDGYKLYWDSSCTQEAVAGCDKSTYYPGYFFDGWS